MTGATGSRPPAGAGPQGARPGPRALHALGALEAAAAMARGRLTSAVLTEHLLARIAAHDPRLHAMIAVDVTAREQAAAADRRRAAGAPLGPLDGVPVIVKDNIEVRGLPGTAGSRALAGAPAERDATLVARMRAAGLVILGSANLSEWANFRGRRSTSGWSAVGGLVDNPWRSGRSAGGSSSGSGAALAAGFAPLAVGTETDGSITCPAALCGVTGLKPTVGAIPVDGVVPIAASQDTPGPMARGVADVAALLEVLTGSPCDPLPGDPGRRFVLGAPPAWLTGEPAVDDLLADRLAQLGRSRVRVLPVDAPAPDDAVDLDEVAVLTHEMGDDLGRYLANRPGSPVRSVADVVAFNREHADVELAHFGQEHLVAAADSGGRASPAYAAARQRNLAWALDRTLTPAFASGVDALVAPAYGTAWTSDLERGDSFRGGLVTTAAAIAGWPILTLPMGLVDGLPVGLSLVGPGGSESTLLAIGRRIERTFGWGGRMPDLGRHAPLGPESRDQRSSG